jgi:hypothetical protein
MQLCCHLAFGNETRYRLLHYSTGFFKIGQKMGAQHGTLFLLDEVQSLNQISQEIIMYE